MRVITVLKASALALVLDASLTRTSAISYHITTDTSALAGSAAGPFSLDFQFIDGSGAGDGNNLVTLGNFNFAGGSWTGTDPGVITLADTSFFSEFLQGFTPGSSLSFDLTFTTAVDPGGVPDAFSFAILDKDLFEVPTQGLGDALLTVNLDSASPQVIGYASDAARTSIAIPAAEIALVQSVPESLNSGLCLAGVFGLLVLRSRKESRLSR